MIWPSKGSPDMILSAFGVKFDEKKYEIPPRACRPSKKLKNNKVEKVNHQQVKNKQCRTRGFTYSYILHIPPNTFIYLHIPSHIPIYFKISNIRKMRINLRPTNGHNSSLRAVLKVRI